MSSVGSNRSQGGSDEPQRRQTVKDRRHVGQCPPGKTTKHKISSTRSWKFVDHYELAFDCESFVVSVIMAVVAVERRALYASALSACSLVCGQFHVSHLICIRICSKRPSSHHATRNYSEITVNRIQGHRQSIPPIPDSLGQ